MHISKVDALSLLRKWQQEKTLLQCALYDRPPDAELATCVIMGFVEQVDEQKLFVSAIG